jgi:hypothetical protein
MHTLALNLSEVLIVPLGLIYSESAFPFIGVPRLSSVFRGKPLHECAQYRNHEEAGMPMRTSLKAIH